MKTVGGIGPGVQMRAIVPFLVAAVGCVSSRSVGYVDDDPGSHPYYSERFPRAWAEGRKIVVEVHQSHGPSKVASIGYTLEEGNIYLTHLNISGGRGETTRMTVDLEGEDLPEDWQGRIYWLTGNSLYPIGHSAFWDESRREPAHRMKVELSPRPGK